ncbi:MAG TPA: sugar phosphate nucleotidyltransferase, partial [Candidatus Saccharimonadales bacterium]|nr:sugar phosphate nucleotidyltransferase [Candidatus Saccharimonadales bacterium]
MRHAIVLAGGAGTRLWPISRADAPKQFQNFAGDLTLIQETCERILPVVPRENIWIVTLEKYRSLINKQLPEIANDHILGEPAGRNTAPA